MVISCAYFVRASGTHRHTFSKMKVVFVPANDAGRSVLGIKFVAIRTFATKITLSKGYGTCRARFQAKSLVKILAIFTHIACNTRIVECVAVGIACRANALEIS
jgi:hypothetical protein